MKEKKAPSSRLERFFEEHFFLEEPFYVPVNDEVEIFRAAYAAKLPVLLKGPTGCGKTRFIEYMSYFLQQERIRFPVHCNRSYSP